VTQAEEWFAGFRLSDLTTAEVDDLESYLVPLADSVRELVDATIRTTVGRDEVLRAKAAIDAVTARLRAEQLPGPAGVIFNAEGRSWQWGNAAVGIRNAAAPQMTIVQDPDGLVHSDVVLGAASEGPPGMVHGGVAALLLDHLMGATASRLERPSMTGTLTLRYRRATPLGPIRLEGRVDRIEGYKTIVLAHIADPDGVTVEAEGVFVMPRWAREHFAMPRPGEDGPPGAGRPPAGAPGREAERP
jgi:acyl-coenzyme A thioesterase PaaI-like protein